MEGKQERFKTVLLKYSWYGLTVLICQAIAMTAEIGTPMLLALYKVIYCLLFEICFVLDDIKKTRCLYCNT